MIDRLREDEDGVLEVDRVLVADTASPGGLVETLHLIQRMASEQKFGERREILKRISNAARVAIAYANDFESRVRQRTAIAPVITPTITITTDPEVARRDLIEIARDLQEG